MKGFPAWSQVASSVDQAGMRLLDPSGPNGWKEYEAWLNSNTIRFRTRLAAAEDLGAGAATGSSDHFLLPSVPAECFPAPPASPAYVFARVVALLQPRPLPASVTGAWLTALWPSTFAWDATWKLRAREFAYLLLCAPSGQLY